MNVVVVYNKKSGSEYSLRRIRTLCRSAGIKVDYSFTVNQLGSVKLAHLIERGVILAVVGGDGTLNAAARLVAGTKSTMLPLPGGTFNHFVRDLGMPMHLPDALEQAPKYARRTVDIAEVNGELFLNNSNVGLYPFSLIERKATKRIVGKWVAAALSVVDQLALFRRHALKIDGKRVHSPFVFVGNNRYDIESAVIPVRTRFDENVLTVMIATSERRLQLLAAVFAVLRGDVSKRSDFTVMERRELSIYSHRSKIAVSLDGEVRRLHPPLVYRIRPSGLRVLAPKN